MSGGIIYEYEDGGSYCGEWEGETSHGYGVCTGPQGAGVFQGLWSHGNQISGVYMWPSGVQYSGRWENNVRHGLGVETRTDGTEYSGEFTKGTRGPFGLAKLPNGVYQGQWSSGAQDGEGVEMYRDHGCYRGQYRKGLRSGFGTRTSAAYEGKVDTCDIHPSTSEPSLQSLRSSSDGYGSLKKGALANIIKKHTDSSSSLQPISQQGSSPAHGGNFKNEVAQIYEGEWLNDKRHGHGVLKVLDKYTYYGQWSNNARTGYGVMLYDNGSKQEGEWHSGTLISMVKKHKVLMFKGHQLELKVKEARTRALQAAETARHKAELATSRSVTAITKSKTAVKIAQKAKGDAQQAIAKADQYKNAPRVSEAIKSPMTQEAVFPPLDSEGTIAAPSAGSSTDSFLNVHTSVVPSSSFEDLHSVYSDSGIHGRGSPGTSKRHKDPRQSMESLSSSAEESCWDSDLKHRRWRLHQQSSSSEQSFESPELKRRSQRRRASDWISARERKSKRTIHSLSDHEEEDERGQRSYRIDHRTGEVGHEDLSDEEGDKPSSVAAVSNKDKVTLDMLNQMAQWNRMVAFLNFALLLVLVLLIVVVFVSMYYYRLLSYYQNHPDPEDQTSPGGFLTPLA